MIRHLLIGAVLAGALLLSGCASVVNGHNQSVSVTTKSQGVELSGAKCSMTNDKGVWYVTTPGSVSVHRSYGELTVNCASVGLPNGIAAVKSSTTGAVFGNILLGGVIGAGIDVATGAAYNYPNTIAIDMGQSTRIESTPAARPTPPPARPAAPAEPSTASVRVPYLNDSQQRQYRAYLTKAQPRAFAISLNGHFAYTVGTVPLDKSLPADPKERALLLCSRWSGMGCELYAADDQVVFRALPPQPQSADVRSRAGRYPADPALAAAKVPYLNEGQLAEYQVFLTHPLPRAFAISDNGHFATAWSNTPLDKSLPSDPKERALAWCKGQAGQACQLYLVDNQIVYARTP